MAAVEVQGTRTCNSRVGSPHSSLISRNTFALFHVIIDVFRGANYISEVILCVGGTGELILPTSVFAVLAG